jgi:hypothetical protein
MMNLNTGKLRLSRDVQWLHKSFGEYETKKSQSREDDTSTNNDDVHDHDDSRHGNGEEDTTTDLSNVENHENDDAGMEEGWHEVKAGKEIKLF